MTRAPCSERDLDAPILPNKGAAGLRLGAKAQAVEDGWGEPFEREQMKPDHVRWSYGSVWLWLQAGRVTQIAVYEGYEGKTKEGVGVGSERTEVEEVYGPLGWDECWITDAPPFGIGFDIGTSALDVPRVTGIYVFRE